jgi:hypothetical protein
MYMEWEKKRQNGMQNNMEEDIEGTHRSLRRGYSQHTERKRKRMRKER